VEDPRNDPALLPLQDLHEIALALQDGAKLRGQGEHARTIANGLGIETGLYGS